MLHPLTRRVAATLGIGAVVVIAAMSQLAGRADAARTDHPSLVPEVAARGYPVIQRDDALEGRGYTNVFAVDQVGPYIVSGGDFRRVELQDETIIDAPSFAAWHVDTKQMVCPGAFDFDDSIHAVESGPRPGTVYVGGRFRVVSGDDGVDHVRRKMALLDLTDCSVVEEFDVRGFDNRVDEIEYESGRLFVAGAFTRVGTHDTVFVAELDPARGWPDPSFAVEGDFDSKAAARALEMNDAGTRLVLVATKVDTLTMGDRSIHESATYVFDIADADAPRLTAHEWPEWTGDKAMHGAGVDDDATRVALAYHKVVHYAELADGPTVSKWTHDNGDGTFDAAVSSNAVYASGHFCRTEAGPGPTEAMSPHYGHTKCSQGGSIHRTQLAAYSLEDGTPLTWNPGNDAQTGGRAITIVPRGMLFGFDGWRVGDRVVGQTAFLDFGPDAEPAVDLACTAVQDGADVVLSWRSIPEVGVHQVRDQDGWVATTAQVGHTAVGRTLDQGWHIRTRHAGDVTDWPCTPVNPGGRSCTATQLGADVRLEWDGFHPDSTVNVRSGGRWLATVRGASTYTVAAADLADRFELRYRLDGETRTLACAG